MSQMEANMEKIVKPLHEEKKPILPLSEDQACRKEGVAEDMGIVAAAKCDILGIPLQDNFAFCSNCHYTDCPVYQSMLRTIGN